MRAPLTAALCLAAAPALAGVAEVVDDHVLPATAAFAEATAVLEGAAAADCRGEALRPAYQDAFDAWLGISHLTLGPLEEDGTGLAIGFWPDARGMVGRTVARLVADEDPVARDTEGFSEVSVAGRGLFALERLLYDEAFAGYGADDYACTLAKAIAADLARMGGAVDAAWREDFAQTLKTAGAEDNSRFLDDREAAQALYTALATGLDFTAQQRLGRPMGSFEAPKPQVAEARRSDRPLRNVVLSLEALRELAMTLSDAPIPRTEAAFDRALETARTLDDPRLAGVAEPAGRLRVEALQTEIRAVTRAAAEEIAPALGVSVGFNSADGD
ncbi:imelysin family protein [Roseivivax sp. GX 12232]|uniref:imelysin family protein n=1 Tax=Roseivivax sp. GX 12232 TaxID=2900547 RepID=UPI001E30AD41|nr:imelysin family protein [Roseivivax sp. GX 12232]MCE0505932.1 imelysin family protein [Roseivivax sp. GX 12232]